MANHRFRPVPVRLVALVAALASFGCLGKANVPVTPTKPNTAAAAQHKKPITVDAHPADALTKKAFDSKGGVKVSFKGLVKPGARAKAPGAKARRLLATTADIDHLTVELASVSASGSYDQRHDLSHDDLVGSFPGAFFDGVPVGPAQMTVTAYDGNGNAIGQGQQTFDVVGGQTSEVNMAVKLSSTGSVSASVSFEETDVQTNNLSGLWIVSKGAEPPAGPVTGCGDGYVWSVQQDGQYVRAWVSGYNDASAADHPGLTWNEDIDGNFIDNHLRLHGVVTYTNDDGSPAGTDSRDYDLVYNADTGHVVGTRNGEAGWGAPFFYGPDCAASPVPAGDWSSPSPIPTDFASWTPGPDGSATPFGGRTPPPTTTLTGKVVDMHGKPPANPAVLSLSVGSAEYDVPFWATVPVASDGTFTVPNVPAFTTLDVSVYDPNSGAGDDEPAYLFLDQSPAVTLHLGTYAAGSPTPSYEPSWQPSWSPSPSWLPTPTPFAGATATPTPTPTPHP